MPLQSKAKQRRKVVHFCRGFLGRAYLLGGVALRALGLEDLSSLSCVSHGCLTMLLCFKFTTGEIGVVPKQKRAVVRPAAQHKTQLRTRYWRPRRSRKRKLDTGNVEIIYLLAPV